MMQAGDRGISDDCEQQTRMRMPTRETVADMSILMVFASLYIATSAVMIAFNKYIIHDGRFPFAVALVLIHCGFSSIMAFALLLVKPSLFPSLTSPTEKVVIDRDLAAKLVLIAILFSVQLVLSNTAYLHSSMAFLQMMKEANLVLVYGMSLLAAMEVFNWVRGRLILLIVVATFLTIRGEINFSWTGFGIQATGQIFESAKIVLQALLLSNVGKKLDVLTYVVLVMPLCFFVLAFMYLCLGYLHPLEHLKTPAWSDIVTWWPILAVNACVAFALNLAIALFMKNSSAVAFILAGIAKDAVIVLSGFVIMHEPVSMLQATAFAFQLLLIWIWSMMKFFPDKFENGVMAGLVAMANSVAKKNSSFAIDSDDAVSNYGSSGNCERRSGVHKQ
jgi:hypothetical protein